MKNIERSDNALINPGKKFSIVFPTRERAKLLTELLDSLAIKTKELSEIEVLIAIDLDDKTDYSFLENYSFVQSFRVPRSLNFSEDYYNYLAAKSVGEWIITANDDARFETQHWDVHAFNSLESLPRVIYGWIEDNLGMYRARGQGDYCCFPLFGRKGYEALGYIFPSRIPTWGCDIWASNLYKQINSRIILPIRIYHYCYHNQTRNQDHLNKRIGQNQVQYSTRPIRQEIEALMKAMNVPDTEVTAMTTVPENKVQKGWNPAHSFVNHRKRRLIMGT
jgi:glycosyltransferase involved in cell wall biosynthesis